MFKKSIKLAALTVFILTISWAMPAKAFFLELPEGIKSFFGTLKTNNMGAQEGATISPAPSTYPSQSVMPAAPMMQPQPTMDGQQMTKPQQGMNFDNQSGQPMMQPNNFNGDNQPMMQPQQGMGPGDQGGQMGPSPEQQEQMQKQNEERQLKDMKRNMRGPENGLKEFERMITKLEKGGSAIPAEIKEKLAKAKSILEAIKNAQTMEDLQNAGWDEFQNLFQELNETRQELFEKAQRLQDIKRNIKGMEQGLKMFEKQLANFSKQKIAVPQTIVNDVAKLKELVNKIKTAKTWDEIESAGLEDMQDLMQKLDESRQQLEILARWPKTIKEVEKQIKNLERELKRSKSTSDRLLKKGVDVTGVYIEFETAVNKLKSIKGEAVNKMNTGESEEAFNLLETDFFGQMEDVWEFQKVITIMSNLGRFASDFKQGIKSSENQIRNLERKKVDTAELKELLNQAKTRGNEILEMMKAKPIDEEEIMSSLQELENLRQDFDTKMEEITGKSGQNMPWEQGPQQFKKVEMPSNFNQYLPKNTTESSTNSGGQTCNINGVETPGPCAQ